MSNDGMRSRKVWMAWFILLTSAIFILTGAIQEGTWLASNTLAIGIYGAANVAEKRNVS